MYCRSHLATIRALALGWMLAGLLFSSPALGSEIFSDVPKDHWAYEAVQKAVDSGEITCCYGPCKFYGEKLINRYQMAVIVKRLMDSLARMAPLSEADQGRMKGIKERAVSLSRSLESTRASLERIERMRDHLTDRMQAREQTAR